MPQMDPLGALRYSDAQDDLARVVGIDTLVNSGSSCAGVNPSLVRSSGATVCDLEGTLRPPYRIPLAAATVGPDPCVPQVQPTDAQLDVPAVLAQAFR